MCMFHIICMHVCVHIYIIHTPHYMYVCMCVYVYILHIICMYICVCICIYSTLYVCMHVYMYMYIYILHIICMHVCVYVCIYVLHIICICVCVCICVSFTLYVCVYIYILHIFFMSSVSGHLVWLYVLDTVNSAAMSTEGNVPFWIRAFVLSVYMTRSGTAGSYGHTISVLKEPPHHPPWCLHHWHSHQKVGGLLFLHILSNVYLLVMAILRQKRFKGLQPWRKGNE